MEDFSEYEKVPKKLNVNDIDFRKLEKLQWVVTEKVHGANFSFIYENRKLKFAKRREYLSWKDDFFGFQLIVKCLEDKIFHFFERLSHDIEAKKYILYGELFGGEYPHPEVLPSDNIKAIQTGVYYSPEIKFCAFDIAIETDIKYYLPYKTAEEYFVKHSIFYAKPLFIGKYLEALNFDTRIDSTIPDRLSLPWIKDNLIEGVVIKPYTQQIKTKNQIRPIIKLKNKEFDEEIKFHQAQKWKYIPETSSNTEDLSFLIDELQNYIIKNRLDSAISKIGALDQNNVLRMSEIEAEFLQDVLTDFNDDNEYILNELNDAQKDWVTIRIKAAIKRLMILIDPK
ncbi:RNA ligase family protein [Aquimarina sediminis]|uniref:RNA ligase family protein n=1 Tax=Aquimarina sediminis TaxID=2070536 RepID=UPI000CA01A13|nr:RNA ligase family protein [Aquimarina sediminis]